MAASWQQRQQRGKGMALRMARRQRNGYGVCRQSGMMASRHRKSSQAYGIGKAAASKNGSVISGGRNNGGESGGVMAGGSNKRNGINTMAASIMAACGMASQWRIIISQQWPSITNNINNISRNGGSDNANVK